MVQGPLKVLPKTYIMEYCIYVHVEHTANFYLLGSNIKMPLGESLPTIKITLWQK